MRLSWTSQVPIRPFALAILGGLSGLLSMTVGGSLGLGQLSPGVFFGILLAAYMWWALGIEAPGGLTLLIAVSGAAFVVATIAATLLPVPELLGDISSRLDPAPTPSLVAGVIGGAILSTAYLAVLPTAPSVSRLLSEMIFCSAAAGVLGMFGAIVGDRFTPPLPLNTGVITIWQGGMAFVLALVAELRSAGVPD
jgi:hypothetical protein